jgi:gentisate 1,2-dioxygenase
MNLSPGDVLVVKRKVDATTTTSYTTGGTVTLINLVNRERQEWRCIDEFGVGTWAWLRSRVRHGELSLLCKSTRDDGRSKS